MRTLLPLLLLLFSVGAAAAPPVDGARAARDAAQVELARITGIRDAQQARHEALAARVAALKAKGEAGLVPGARDGRLDALLREANAQAEDLAALDRGRAAAEEALEAAQRALAAALTAALTEGQQALPALPPAERAAAFERLRALALEQSALTAALAAAPEAPPRLPRLSASERGAGPDELRELADEAQDNAERVRRQLEAVEARLAALRDRRRLIRAAVAFRRDEVLFAEAERNRIMIRSGQPAPSRATPTGEPAGQPTGVDQADSPPQAPAVESADPGVGTDRGSEDFDNAAAPGAPEAGGLGAAPVDLADAVGPGLGAGGGAALLTVDQVLDPALFAEGVDQLSPEGLARQIAAIEAQKQALEASAEALERRRRGLERRAADLEGR